MTICLAMIVRDEAANLLRCLEAAGKIADSAFLIDTGSTDGTQEVARSWAETAGMPLALVEEPWENFQVNRSSLLRQAANRADWLLMLDAYLVVHAPDPLPDLGRADCWQGWVKFSGMDYTLPFLVRGSKPWRYEGVAHSYLACDEPFDEATMDGLWVEDYSHTTVAKLERDLAALGAEHARDPLSPRTTFYLAQTYYDLDRFEEAAQFYRARAYMDSGWDEEQYYAAYRLGSILCEHISFSQGAKELLRAWEMRPHRVEALRALAGCANSVADKIPPPDDRLFVHTGAYKSLESGLPSFPDLTPQATYLPQDRLCFDDVTAIIPTRGNVDMRPILDALPYGETIVWDNSKREIDYKAFGRYAAIPEATRPIIYWQDDDVIFTAHEKLMEAYERGKLVCNMDQSWVDGAGYENVCGMQGAGSLCGSGLPKVVWDAYLGQHPWDEEALVEADFVFGALVPFKRVDLGYQVRPFSDDPDRLYTQPGQTKRKWEMINRCREMKMAA